MKLVVLLLIAIVCAFLMSYGYYGLSDDGRDAVYLKPLGRAVYFTLMMTGALCGLVDIIFLIAHIVSLFR